MLSKVTRFADPFHAIERRDRRAIARQWIDVVCLAIGPTPRAARLTAPARRGARLEPQPAPGRRAVDASAAAPGHAITPGTAAALST